MIHPHVKHPDLFKRERAGVAKFNHNLAIRLGDWLGNMYFFYICVVLDLIMLPPVIQAGNTTLWVTYIAQTVVQLLALPVLQVYQNISAEADEAKAEADHQTLTYLATLQDEQLEILKELKNGH